MPVTARLLPRDERAPQQQGALDLARRLPALIVAAKEIASSALHGVHGRRRAGIGETFWQFRPFVAGESAAGVDWRRSARDDRIYVREREWESAHTVWIWIDRSPSMAYQSSLAMQPKLDRAVVLGLAAADLLVRGGERVGLSGLTRPVASRNVIERFAEALAHDRRTGDDELPPAGPLPPRVRIVMIGDFLTPPEEIAARIDDISARGARGHLLMIADPVEETFPFSGHTEFADVDSSAMMRIGQAERFRDAYVRRLSAHRDAVAAIVRAKGWSLALHRTDRPASEALLALRMRLEQGSDLFAAGSAVMLGLPLAFTIPFALVALAGLPVLYVLLKVTPPRPERVPFPPLKLILDLRPKDETPANTPWWLLLLRLVLATLVILAMAGPIWNPISVGTKGTGSLLVALDTSWAAAPTWERRVVAAAQRIEAARQQSRTVAVAASSDGAKDIIATDPATALERLHALAPAPYAPDRMQLAGAIARFVKAHADTTIVWESDGLERGAGRAFAQALAALPVKTILIADDKPVLAITDPRNDGDKLAVRVLRSAVGDGGANGRVRALDMKGLTIAEAPYAFANGEAADATFDQPIELRNQIARLEVVGARSAGAVTLLDARWKRRSVGIVSGDTADTAQPLLAAAYYLHKALGPFADVHEPKPGTPDPIGAMLDDHVNVLILADYGTLTGPIRQRLSDWVDGGGLLVRFAGTRLSGATDDLVPVKLRRGGRVLGGTLSWEKPKHLAAFEPPSPFVGLKVPDEVTITRQVLAEPEPGLPAKTWAQLSDGTPLVTAAARGKGRVVLFHVTADTTWSNLPISGLFVDMLKKIVALSGESARAVSETEAKAAQASRTVETVSPTRTLDGFGTLGAPPPSAKPVPTTFGGIASQDHPPGFYGQAESLLAVNALAPEDKIPAVDLSGLSFQTAPLQAAEPVDLRPWLIAGAFVLFCLDALAALWLGGKLRFSPRRAAAAALGLAVIGLGVMPSPQPARADPTVIAGQLRSDPGSDALPSAKVPAASPGWLRFARNDEQQAPIKIAPNDLSSALSVRLAYVVSGDAKVDEISRQGLATLSTTLAARTSLTPGDPIGIDPAKDELAFYPVLYWPIVATSPQPSQKAIEKISAYMRNGGTIVFDTRDAGSVHPNGEPSPATAWLRQLLSGVDVPELEPIPSDHVVTKTFYLIDNFIGRYASGETWIEALPPPIGDKEARPARSGDGVSPIILTSNDLAAGWAGDDYGEPLYALIPGDPRQHEIALRGGINLVMYTLTGNYKADQVHVRDLLERLGH